VADMLPARYRGFLEVDLAVCTGCPGLRARCPIDVIKIAGRQRIRANPKQRVITQFDIDESKCMFCGLCVEPCPTGAIAPHARVRVDREGGARIWSSAGCPTRPSRRRSTDAVKGQDAPRAPAGSLMRVIYLASRCVGRAGSGLGRAASRRDIKG